MARTRRLILVVVLLTGALVVLVLASLAVGSRLVPVGTVLEAVTRFDPGSNEASNCSFNGAGPKSLILLTIILTASENFSPSDAEIQSW